MNQNIADMDTKLVDRFEKLKKFVKKRFHWEVPEYIEEEEDEEDAPVIVEM